MMVTCNLHWMWFDLPGQCAQWFSGTISSLAVGVALAGYFVVERRFRKEKTEKNSEELAGLSILIADTLEEAEANFRLVRDSISDLTIHGKTYQLLPAISALNSRVISGLDKSQSRFLLSHGLNEFCNIVRNSIAHVNSNNSFLNDYSNSRTAFAKFANSNFLPNVEKSSDIAKIGSARLTQLDSDTNELSEKSRSSLQNIIEICRDFNSFDFGAEGSELSYRIEFNYAEKSLSK